MGVIYYGVRHEDKVAICLGKHYWSIIQKPNYCIPSLYDVTNFIETNFEQSAHTAEYAKEIFDTLTSFGKIDEVVSDARNIETEDGKECHTYTLTHSVWPNDKDIGFPIWTDDII